VPITLMGASKTSFMCRSIRVARLGSPDIVLSINLRQYVLRGAHERLLLRCMHVHILCTTTL
jgi:hypothetical protein